MVRAKEPTCYHEPADASLETRRITKEEYAAAESALIYACADVVVYDPNESQCGLYLIRRSINPLQGRLWLFGGSRMRSETALAAAMRHFSNDTGLRPDTARFEFLSIHEYVFGGTQDYPRGRHNIVHTYAIALTKDERAVLKLDPREYDLSFGLQRFTLSELEREANLHPVIPDLYRALFPS